MNWFWIIYKGLKLWKTDALICHFRKKIWRIWHTMVCIPIWNKNLSVLISLQLIICKCEPLVLNLSVKIRKILLSLIGPTHMLLKIIRIVRTMRRRVYMPPSLFGHKRTNLLHVLHLSRFKRIGKMRWNLLLMFPSVIEFLMNYLNMETFIYLTLYRRRKS